MKRKAKTWTVQFSDRELNYLERALHADCRAMQKDMAGNVPQLFRFQKKLLRKVERLRKPARFCTVWR